MKFWNTLPRRGWQIDRFRVGVLLGIVFLIAAHRWEVLGAVWAGIQGILFCPFKLLTGWPCPGCGMTRALWALAGFRFSEALAYHPFVWSVPLMILKGPRAGRLANFCYALLLGSLLLWWAIFRIGLLI